MKDIKNTVQPYSETNSICRESQSKTCANPFADDWRLDYVDDSRARGNADSFQLDERAGVNEGNAGNVEDVRRTLYES